MACRLLERVGVLAQDAELAPWKTGCSTREGPNGCSQRYPRAAGFWVVPSPTRHSDLVLTIGGDRVRSGTGAAALVGFLARKARLRPFSFGLVEAAAFEIDGGVLLHSRVLAKTSIVQRTVVVPLDKAGNELVVLAIYETVASTDPATPVEQQEQTEYGQWLAVLRRDGMEARLDGANQREPPKPPKP